MAMPHSFRDVRAEASFILRLARGPTRCVTVFSVGEQEGDGHHYG